MEWLERLIWHRHFWPAIGLAQGILIALLIFGP